LRNAVGFLSSVLLASHLAFASTALAGTALEGKPKVSFFATGSPGFMSIEGVSSAVTLADDGTRLTFTVPMSTVDSGIALRDEHMNKNYVQIDQFPNAVIDFAKGDVTWPTDGSATGTVAANFTIHGITQPATVGYTISKTKTGYRVKARFDYDVSKHGITIEPYMGISFDHKMYATATLDLVDAP
jgi:polyisoprenoid-binding protein YceI